MAPVTTPATLPTTRSAADGDLIVQIGKTLNETGITETVVQSSPSQWMLAASGVFLGLLMARLASGMLNRLGERSGMRVKLFRSVLFSSLAGPVGLFLFMIGMAVGLQFLVVSPVLRGFLLQIFQLLNIICIGWLLYNLVDLLTLVLNRWTRGRQGNLSVMLVPLARKTLRVMLVIVLLLFAAENVFNQDVKSLLAGLGIAGLAVSLAAQDSIRNLFGSVMIFADQPFAIGEFIEVMGHKGTVEDIGFRSTRIRTIDGYLLTIPNSKIADSPVQNNSRRNMVRRVVEVGLPADTSAEQVEKVLQTLREIFAQPEITKAFDLEKDPVRIAFDEMQGNLLRLKVFYWFRNGNYWDYLSHAQSVNLQIINRLNGLDIKFLFPS
jgi:MscS family membrane protein